MARYHIRNWLADCIRQSPRLHACLTGAGSIVNFWPGPPPRFRRNNGVALTAEMRMVGDAMWAAVRRAKVEFGNTAAGTGTHATQAGGREQPVQASGQASRQATVLSANRG